MATSKNAYAAQNPYAADVTDVESRRFLQTKTGTQQNWDQVLGVSQRVINKNFATLHKYHKELQEIYSTHETLGGIDAQLDPCTVLIPGGDSTTPKGQLLFQLRFKSGNMSSSTGDPVIEDLSGWIISCPVTVDKQKVSITSKMTEAEITDAKKKNAWIDRFDVAGDYSAERMFAKFSSIVWTQFDPANSYATDKDGKRITFNAWSASHSETFMNLTVWLLQWSNRLDSLGKNNIGLSVQIPPVVNVNKPTYEPVMTMNQVYPYISNKQGAPEGATGETGPAECNAYLYTEMVKIPNRDEKRPTDHGLLWSGNWCTQPFINKQGKQDTIDGTFVIDAFVFIQTFLLPELRPINKAVDIYHQVPEGPYYSDSDHRICAATPFTIGEDPNHREYTDPVFAFTSINPSNDAAKQSGYRFEKENSQPEKTFLNGFARECDLKSSTYDKSTVLVTWVGGGSTINISGTGYVKLNCIWNKGWEQNKSWDDLWAWIKDEYTITWSLDLEISTVPGEKGNGMLDINVKGGPDNVSLDVKWNKQQVNIDNAGKEDAMRNQLRSNFKAVIPTMLHNLKEALKGRGRFVFPGNGVFDFSEPMLGNFGNLIARVDYKPLAKNDKLFIPRPPKLEDKKNVTPPTIPNKAQPKEGQFLLTWTRINGDGNVPAALTRSKIWLRAENKSQGDTCAFQQIKIDFPSSSTSSTMFAESDWVVKTDGLAASKEASATKSNETAQATETTSKEAAKGTETASKEPVKETTKPLAQGTVTLRQSITGTIPAGLFKLARFGKVWNVYVDTTGADGILKLAPGDWFEVEFEGLVGPAGEYQFAIREQWDIIDADTTGSYRDNIKIPIVAAV